MYHLCVIISTFFLFCRNSEQMYFEPNNYLYRGDYMDYSTIWNYSKLPYFREHRSAVAPVHPLRTERATIPDPCCSHPESDHSNGNFQWQNICSQ